MHTSECATIQLICKLGKMPALYTIYKICSFRINLCCNERLFGEKYRFFALQKPIALVKVSLYTIYKICRMANLGVSLDKAYIVDKAFAKRLVSFIIRVYTFRKMIEYA